MRLTLPRLCNDKKKYFREKAIQAFQAILHKYDVEVGEERTQELDELRSALELQRNEFALWTETVCEPQIKQYVLNELTLVKACLKHAQFLMEFLIRCISISFLKYSSKIIKSRRTHAREGRSRETRNGTSNDDIYDEPIS